MKVQNANSYALFDYLQYIDRNSKKVDCNIPLEQRSFDIGDVVYIKDSNSIGVVIGCVDYESQDLRTDMEGMQCFSNLELATKEHFNIKKVVYTKKLGKEFK